MVLNTFFECIQKYNNIHKIKVYRLVLQTGLQHSLNYMLKLLFVLQFLFSGLSLSQKNKQYSFNKFSQRKLILYYTINEILKTKYIKYILIQTILPAFSYLQV